MKIKVHFIGNTCNYGYWFAKYFQNSEFIDAKVFIEKTNIERDYPWWDDETLDKNNLPSWIIMMPSFNISGGFFSGEKGEKIIEELKKCDLIHAIGSLSALWAMRTGRPYIYHSYGDIMSTPFLQSKISIKNYLRIILSRRAIKKSQKIILSQICDLDAAVRLGVYEKCVLLPLFYDTKIVSRLNFNQKFNNNKEFEKWELIFYSPSRHIRLKRQDKVLRSFFEFLKITNKNALLILTDWGDCVQESKALIGELELTQNVKWIPCQTRLGLMEHFMINNVAVLDEFEDPPMKMSFGGISRDALSMESVLITSLDICNISKLHQSTPPILWTNHSEDSILKRMLQFSNMTEEERIKIGKDGRVWLQNEHEFMNLSNRYFKIYLESLQD